MAKVIINSITRKSTNEYSAIDDGGVPWQILVRPKYITRAGNTITTHHPAVCLSSSDKGIQGGSFRGKPTFDKIKNALVNHAFIDCELPPAAWRTYLPSHRAVRTVALASFGLAGFVMTLKAFAGLFGL